MAELKNHYEKQVVRTPLLFDRMKSEKQLMATYIRAYYEPIVGKNDVIFSDNTDKQEKVKVCTDHAEHVEEVSGDRFSRWARRLNSSIADMEGDLEILKDIRR